MGRIRRGYKQTEIGEIPEDWEVVRLGNLSLTTSGGTPNTQILEYWGGQIKWMASGELHLKMVYDTKERITDAGLRSSSTKIIPPYCVLIGLAGQGKTRGTVAMNMVELCINQSIGAIYPSKNFLPKYLYYNLDGRYDELREISSGDGGRGGLNLLILNALLIPLPPLDEQRRIAEALSDADAQIMALAELIAKKRDIKHGTMQRLLTGQERLAGFSGEWGNSTIENLAYITTGSKNTEDKIEDGEYPFFVRSSNIERINSYSFDGEAVLTAGDGVGTGKVFHYINGKFDFHQRVYKISNFNEQLNGYFFYLYFSNHFYNRIMSMTAKSSVDSVRMEMIANMIIPIPPIDEQIAIARVLSDMDAEIEALQTKHDKLVMIKQGMMHELLTGKVRL